MVKQFLLRLDLYLYNNPATPLLSIYPREIKAMHTKIICIQRINIQSPLPPILRELVPVICHRVDASQKHAGFQIHEISTQAKVTSGRRNWLHLGVWNQRLTRKDLKKFLEVMVK
jgi:hypothetical protein